MADLARADNAIRRFLTQTDRMITLSDAAGRMAARELLETLIAADRSVQRRLEIWIAANGGDHMRFSEASMLAYREQLSIVIRFVQGRLSGMLSEHAMRAAETSASRSMKLIRDLERAYTGVVVPLRTEEAMIMRMRPSLLARHATSVDRYGMAMINRMQREMAQGFVEGISQREMVNRLVQMGGPRGAVSIRAFEMQPGLVVRTAEEWIPEGLFLRYRSWAWRIVRTEVAEAQNAVSQVSYEEAREELPDMHRKILAMMDNRTAQDSLGVHGQIRALGQPFVDGAGRVYDRPPSRPNDRETLMPWRPHWEETKTSRPLSEAERERIWERNRRWQETRHRRRARLKRQHERFAEGPPG